MSKSTLKLLKTFYSIFHYRNPRVFWREWKYIKRSWEALPQPQKHKAQKKMRDMLARYDIAVEKAQRALPNYQLISEAAKILAEQGLPYGERPDPDASAWMKKDPTYDPATEIAKE